MRLRPDRAVLLFGPHTESLCKAVEIWKAGATRKIKLVGNMVAPICAKGIASLIDEHLGSGRACPSLEDGRRGPQETTRSKRPYHVEAT